jgi:hypothetical protein
MTVILEVGIGDRIILRSPTHEHIVDVEKAGCFIYQTKVLKEKVK